MIHVWNAETCHLLHSTLTRQHRDAISVSLQPVSALLFYSSSVIIYFCYRSVRKMRICCCLFGLQGLAFRRGTHDLYSASFDRTVKVWNVSENGIFYVETL